MACSRVMSKNENRREFLPRSSWCGYFSKARYRWWIEKSFEIKGVMRMHYFSSKKQQLCNRVLGVWISRSGCSNNGDTDVGGNIELFHLRLKTAEYLCMKQAAFPLIPALIVHEDLQYCCHSFFYEKLLAPNRMRILRWVRSGDGGASLSSGYFQQDLVIRVNCFAAFGTVVILRSNKCVQYAGRATFPDELFVGI